MIEIQLTHGKVALIDDEDWPLVSGYKWHAMKSNRRWYAKTDIRSVNGKKKFLLMHRLILGLTAPEIKVDHRDGDGLDNRRANLRECTISQNMHNRAAYANNTSGFKGVSWHKQTGKWRASIRVNKKQVYLGLFDDPAEGHAAYCAAARELHGEFANTGINGEL